MKPLYPCLALLLGGCALLTKAEPMEPRFLSPLDPEPPVATPVAAAADGRSLALRLRRVRASGHLERRVVVREGEHDVRFLEEVRWTVPPADIVERRLERVLFEQRGLSRIVGGAGATLEVRVTGFELVLDEEPRARVELTCLLHDERRSSWRETIVVERPTALTGEDPPAGPAFAEAMGVAIDEAVTNIADRVVPVLIELDDAPRASGPDVASPPRGEASVGDG